MTVFSILFMVVGVVLYREHNINIFYVILSTSKRVVGKFLTGCSVLAWCQHSFCVVCSGLIAPVSLHLPHLPCVEFLHRLIDPGPAPNAAATAPATTAKPLQLTEAQRAGVVASTHGAQDLNVLESGSSVPVVPAQPTEDMPRISVKHEL